MRWWWLTLLWACDGEGGGQPDLASTPVDAVIDARSVDAAVDGGRPETGPPDAAPRDAAPIARDAALADSGSPPDTAAIDAASVDASVDAVRVDAARVDAAPVDAATPRPDAAVDAAPPPPDAALEPDAAPAVGPCAQPIDLNAEIDARGFYDGTTLGRPPTTLGSCGGGAAGEVAFRYTAIPGIAVAFDTNHPETLAPTVIYLRAACDDAADLACVRGRAENPGARLVFVPPHAGPWYLFIDSNRRDGGGPFRLTVGPPPPSVCYDGRDNDGDGRTDLNDPGCTGENDGTEEDPPTPPLCADGLDNDRDGDADYPSDLDCLAAGHDGEVDVCMPEEPCGGRNVGPTFSDGTFLGGLWMAWRWTPREPGVVGRIEVFSGERAGPSALYLHTSVNDQPGERLGSGAFDLAVPNGWQGANLDVPVSVEGGVGYWIMWDPVERAQSNIEADGEGDLVEYLATLDEGRTWLGPHRGPLKFRVFCCLE